MIDANEAAPFADNDESMIGLKNKALLLLAAVLIAAVVL
jgi:hypothetical protein